MAPHDRACAARPGARDLARSPLEDLANERFAAAPIRGLEELRLAASEERLDARLALGGGGELVPAIERLIRAGPAARAPARAADADPVSRRQTADALRAFEGISKLIERGKCTGGTGVHLHEQRTFTYTGTDDTNPGDVGRVKATGTYTH